MSSGAGNILLALEARLRTIKTAAGYTNSVKTVRINDAGPTISEAEANLPLIEIIDESERTEASASATYKAIMNVILYVVVPKKTGDVAIQSLLKDIRKSLFGGSASASGNTGMKLAYNGADTCTGIRYLGYQGDLNMVSSNRTYLMRFEIWSHKLTYQD